VDTDLWWQCLRMSRRACLWQRLASFTGSSTRRRRSGTPSTCRWTVRQPLRRPVCEPSAHRWRGGAAFLLNHSNEYHGALVLGLCEYALELALVPAWKAVGWIKALGACCG
jgi:hypothetical protein